MAIGFLVTATVALCSRPVASAGSAASPGEAPGQPVQRPTFEVQSSGTHYPLNDVCFTDALHGWAVGGGGDNHKDYILLRTSNGGRTWESVTIETASVYQLDSVFFLTPSLGWLSGYRGVILRTTDGGDTWTGLPSGSTYKLAQIQFVDEQHGWVVQAAHTHFMRTTDGGNTWTHHPIGISNDLLEISFVDPMHGWALGNKSLLAQTTDGGLSWGKQEYGSEYQMYSLLFRDLDRGWIGAREIRNTSDGGQTWNLQLARRDLPEFINDLAFATDSIGWGVGSGGYVIHTTDGGQTWVREAEDETPNELRSLSLVGTADLWAVGADGTILHRKGPELAASPTPRSTATPTPTSTATPSPRPTTTPTPTATPLGPWLSLGGSSAPLLLQVGGRAEVRAVFGNMPATTIISATLTGAATFADGQQEFSAGITTSAGAGTFPVSVRAAPDATPGQPFRLTVTMEGATTGLDGSVAHSAWMPFTVR